MSIKKYLRTSRITRGLYQKLYSFKIKLKKRNTSARLKKHGAEVLIKLKQTLEGIDAQWFLAYGTCLGALRNGDFISHDLDMDFYLLPNESADLNTAHTALAEAGFTHFHDFLAEGVLCESTWGYQGVRFDITVLEEKDEGFGTYLFNRFAHEKYADDTDHSVSLSIAPPISGTSYIELAGVAVPVPSNAIEFMELYYGENWIVPNPAYTWQDSKSSRILTDKRGVIRRYKIDQLDF